MGSGFGQNSPEIYLGPKSFRSVFEKRTPEYFLGVPLLCLAKSMYPVQCVVSCWDGGEGMTGIQMVTKIIFVESCQLSPGIFSLFNLSFRI